jgi:hypothetical protein
LKSTGASIVAVDDVPIIAGSGFFAHDEMTREVRRTRVARCGRY